MVALRRLHWSETAINDLTRIGRRVAVASAANADRRVDRIEAKVEALAAFPEIGYAGAKPGTCELVAHPHYFVIYRVLPDGVHVLCVKYSARKSPG